MAEEKHTDEPIAMHDDNTVMDYLLKNVKGISNVSGGVMGEALEEEYAAAEAEARLGQDLEPETDVV